MALFPPIDFGKKTRRAFDRNISEYISVFSGGYCEVVSSEDHESSVAIEGTRLELCVKTSSKAAMSTSTRLTTAASKSYEVLVVEYSPSSRRVGGWEYSQITPRAEHREQHGCDSSQRALALVQARQARFLDRTRPIDLRQYDMWRVWDFSINACLSAFDVKQGVVRSVWRCRMSF